MHLHTIRDTIPAASFTLRRRRIENAADRLIFRTLLSEQFDTATAGRLQERYRQHRASLFACFDRPNVPPANNASEQDFRPSVIHRKVTGGFRSWAGAKISAILTSLFATACKRGQRFLDLLRTNASPSPLHAAGLPG
ncbi:MAG: transposase [Chloroflexi bacterium]|nr:transposase [Chloroflexota bacterium]